MFVLLFIKEIANRIPHDLKDITQQPASSEKVFITAGNQCLVSAYKPGSGSLESKGWLPEVYRFVLGRVCVVLPRMCQSGI